MLTAKRGSEGPISLNCPKHFRKINRIGNIANSLTARCVHYFRGGTFCRQFDRKFVILQHCSGTYCCECAMLKSTPLNAFHGAHDGVP